MPISFACDCGKQLKVADAHAGKRAKCPACGNPVSVPALPPPPAPEPATDEDAAFRALSDGPDPEPSARTWRDAPTSLPPPPPPPRAPASYTAPPPAKKEPPKRKPSRERDPYAERGRKWSVDWGQIGGGIVGIAIGGALLAIGLANGRFIIWSVVILGGGVLGVMNGLFNVSRE